MNVNQIEIVLSQKVSGASTNLELLQYAKALQLLKTNGVFVVSSYGGLPAAASNEGKIYFIEDIETVVWSNGTVWLRLLDKNTIQFQLFAWGGTASIGDGTTVAKCSPVREFCSATDWKQIRVGYQHTTAIKTSGELWVWGCNLYGRLGNGTTITSCSPIREISSSTDWCQVSEGGYHSLGLRDNCTARAWGITAGGQLGDGTSVVKSSPVSVVGGFTDWCQLTAGCRHNIGV